MKDIAEIGHNNPPDPIELVTTEYADLLAEVENWTDGELVETEGQEKAVDDLLREFRKYGTALKKAGEERTKPLHAAWKAEVAAVKIYLDDAGRMKNCLVAAVAPFKEKAERLRKEAERKAWEEAQEAKRAAQEAEDKSNAADLEAQREVEAARQAAIDAEKAAQTQSKQRTKGMRTVKRHEIVDMRALVNWIAINDKSAMAEFATNYASSNHEELPNDVVRSWTEKEAY